MNIWATAVSGPLCYSGLTQLINRANGWADEQARKQWQWRLENNWHLWRCIKASAVLQPAVTWTLGQASGETQKPSCGACPLALCNQRQKGTWTAWERLSAHRVRHTWAHTYPKYSACQVTSVVPNSLRTIACQLPRSMGFPRQECWNGLPLSLPRDLPKPEIEPASLCLLH